MPVYLMRLISRVPMTLGFLVIMVIANIGAGTLSGVLPDKALMTWGISHRGVLNGDIYRLVTGTFLSHDVGMFARQFCFAAIVVGLYEWIEGSKRAICVFVIIDIVGSLIVLFVILPLLITHSADIGLMELLTHDVGMSAGGFGLIGALVAKQDRGVLLLAVVSIAIAVKMWISFEIIADSAHLLCLYLGFGLQKTLMRWDHAPK